MIHERELRSLAASKDLELEGVKETIYKLKEELEAIKHERETATRAQDNSNAHQLRAKNLSDTLVKREKKMTDLRLELLNEQSRVQSLEEELEKLKEKTNEEDIDDLRKKLRETTSDRDRQRNQLKLCERQLKHSNDLVQRASNNGELLKGAAHLVKPNERAKLPKTIVACSECYAYNLQCDNGAQCRSCMDRNTTCQRWRCALKHRLGGCTMTPCKFPHDSQGWLMTQTERPQW